MSSGGQHASAATAAELPPLPKADGIVNTKSSFNFSLYQTLCANANECRDGTAYRAKLGGLWTSWTWAQVEHEVAEIHGLLVRAGVRPGALVAIGGEANPRLYWYFLAVQRAGAVPLLLNSRIALSEFISSYSKAEFEVFIAGSETQVDVAINARSVCPKLLLVLALDRGLEIDSHRGFVFTEQDLQGPSCAIASPADHAVVISTYDETGEHILVVCSHASIAKAAKEFAALAGMKKNDQLVSFLPISWFGDFLQFSAAICERALLSSVENAATVFQDLRVLSPDVILAPISFYRKILSSIEVDIRHSSRMIFWIYQWSNSSAAYESTHTKAGVGVVHAIIAGFLNTLFRIPLRNIIGFSKVRSAFCGEGVLPPNLAASFRSLGVQIRPIDLDARYGGVLGSVAYPAAEGGAVDIAIDGVDLMVNVAGHAFCRSEFAATGLMVGGGKIVPLKTDDGGWGRVSISGRTGKDNATKFLEDIDFSEPDSRIAASLRAHITRLNSDLLIRHSILRPDGRGSWIAVINPDCDFLRAISPDSGSRYHQLIEQHEVVAAMTRIVRRTNTLAEQRKKGIVAHISSFAWFADPLSADAETLTRHGNLQNRRVHSLVPVSALDPTSVHVKIPQSF